MTGGAWRRSLVCAATLLVALAQGCASGPARQTVGPTAVISAQTPVAESRLLDVGIHVLEVPKESAAKDDGASNPEIRAAEARFIPFHLKQTLQGTGYWGAVRVVPDQAEEADVSVKGRLVESNGEVLKVQFRVADVTGRLWFDNEYVEEVTEKSYAAPKGADYDPFQDLYNRVANDMLEHLRTLSPSQIAEIRRVSLLKFARSVAPYAFSGYLAQDDAGITSVRRLPADSDPMLQRVEKIRQREFMFIDTVNQYYGNLYNDMREPYGQWRKSYLEEATQKRDLEMQAWGRRILGAAAVVGAALLGAQVNISNDDDSSKASRQRAATQAAQTLLIIGGIEVFRSGGQFASDAKIHEDAIKELGASFKGDVAPIVEEVDGRTLKLSGSVETQYAEWRRTLRELFAAETGQSPDTAAAAGAAPEKNGGIR